MPGIMEFLAEDFHKLIVAELPDGSVMLTQAENDHRGAALVHLPLGYRLPGVTRDPLRVPPGRLIDHPKHSAIVEKMAQSARDLGLHQRIVASTSSGRAAG